jgi:RimJ/RimL family protein N-acetyltransferase
VLFHAGAFRAFEMQEKDIARLQRFYEANPEYHWSVGGIAPRPGEAENDFRATPPRSFPYSRKWMVGFEDAQGELAGVADVLADLFAPRVWHVGLFIVATPLYGQGAAAVMYHALEDWMRAEGAHWLRLGVAEGNTRGERFWEKSGYVEVRRCTDYPVGARLATLRVMVKPLAQGDLEAYLAAVARDRPESP